MHAPAEGLNPSSDGRAQPIAEPVDPRHEVVLGRHDDLGGSRRRRRAEIRHEVGDRDVRLVADGRNDRDGAERNRARDDLFVERPEILDRTAASRDDDDVHAGDATDGPQAAGDLECRRLRPARERAE